MTNMYGQDVDAMYEAAVSKEWEELNETDEDNHPEWSNAIQKLENALSLLNKVEDELIEAAGCVSGCAEYDRIESLTMSLNNLFDDVSAQKSRMKGVK